MTHSRYKTTFNREKIIRLLIIAIIVLSALFVFIMRTGDNNIKLDKSDIKSEEQISEKTGDDQAGQPKAFHDSPQSILQTQLLCFLVHIYLHSEAYRRTAR